MGGRNGKEILDSGFDPEKIKRANDAVRLSLGGGLRNYGKRGLGQCGASSRITGVVSGFAQRRKPGGLELGSQKSLGGREKKGRIQSENEKGLRSERAGDGGGRNIGGAEAPFEGAPIVPAKTCPITETIAAGKQR